jgi:hypothetical protein
MQVKYFILTENMKSQPKFQKAIGEGQGLIAQKKWVLEANRDEEVPPEVGHV